MSLSLKLLLLAVFISCMLLMGTTVRKRKKKVLFLGDSITEFATRPGGYIAVISDFLREADMVEKVTLVGSGVSGNQVYDVYHRLDQDGILRDPNVVVLYIGVNDIWNKQKHGTGTELKSFTEFYQSILEKLVGNNIKVIICTPAIIGESAVENEEEWIDLLMYGQAIKDLAAKFAIPVADLHASFKNYYTQYNTGNIDEGVLTTDGVHLNAAGNKLVAEEIWKLLKHFI